MHSALNSQQREALQKARIDTKINNERYLREHPELLEMTKQFLLTVLEYKPEDTIQFAASYFSQMPSEEDEEDEEDVDNNPPEIVQHQSQEERYGEEEEGSGEEEEEEGEEEDGEGEHFLF